MDASNVSIVFSPNFLRQNNENSNSDSILKDSSNIKLLVISLIENYQKFTFKVKN